MNELEEEPPRHDRAYLAWGILISIVSLAGMGVLTMPNAALIGAALMIATRCCSVNQAEKVSI